MAEVGPTTEEPILEGEEASHDTNLDKVLYAVSQCKHKLTSLSELSRSERNALGSEGSGPESASNCSEGEDASEPVAMSQDGVASHAMSAPRLTNDPAASNVTSSTGSMPKPPPEPSASDTWTDDDSYRRLAALATQRSCSAMLASETPEATVAAAAAAGEDRWLHHLKQFFILSSSGKPIYSYHGDESSLAGLMALITALVSVVQAHGDSLHHMMSGSTLIVFMTKGPLVLVATSRLAEPVIALQRQLELLYCQVLLVVTTGLERIIQRNPSYDARALLQGVDSILGELLQQVGLDASYLLCSLRPLPLPMAERALAQQALTEGTKSCPAAHYALLMMGGHILAADRAKQQPPLEPLDVMLLANFVTSNHSYRHGAGEAFCPVCLPGYNPEAFLHAHVDYLDRDAGIYLVLLAGSSESFHQLSAARAVIGKQLSASGLLPRIAARVKRGAAASAAGLEGLGGGGGGGWAGERAAAAEAKAKAASSSASASSERPRGGQAWPSHDAGPCGYISIESLPRPMGGRLGATPLWHFTCRFPSKQQLLSAEPCEQLRNLKGRQQLAHAYARLFSLVMDCTDTAKPNRLVWLADDRLAMLAMLDAEMELYMAMDPLTDEGTASQMADALKRHLCDKRVQADLLL